MNYKRISSGEVDPDLNRIALKAVRDAAWDLGLGNIRVQWVKRGPTDPTAGWHDERWPDVVHLAIDWAEDNGPEQLRAIIFHEARHAWQKKPERQMRFIGYGLVDVREDDANAYAYRKTRTHLIYT